MTQNHHAYRPDIEGLRGVAILLVVAFHCGVPGVRGGFIGVDVFFVLSGYLITGLLCAEATRTGGIDLPAFYARRVRRLLPASTLMLLATLGGALLLLAPQELDTAARAGRATALYLANVYFASNAADYFGAGVRGNPLLHMWSLAVEEQFYLVWPAGLAWLWRWRARRSVIVGALGVITAASLLTSVVLTPRDGIQAFYGLPSRAWEFGLGALAGLLGPGSRSARSRAWGLAGAAGLAAVAAAAYGLRATDAFPGWIALWPVLGTAAVLIAGRAAPGTGVARWLGAPPLVGLGTLSYSWYLWHWPFLVLGAALVPGLTVAANGALALAALAVAALSYHGVEAPVRHLPALAGRRAPSLYLGLALTALAMVASLAVLHLARRHAAAPEFAPIIAATADIATLPRERCVSLGASAQLKTCTFGDPQGRTRVVLFGDSHAIQWFDALDSIARARHWRLTTLVKSGCPAADLAVNGAAAGGARGCVEWRRQAVAALGAEPPDLIVLGSSTGFVAADEPAQRDGATPAEWGAATRRTLEALARTGARVLLLRDTPRPPFNVPTCLARLEGRPQSWHGTCDFPAAQAFNAAALAAESAAAQGLGAVSFIDLGDRLCPDGRCAARAEGVILYRDDNHLTGRGAALYAPALGARIDAVFGRPAG